MSDRFKCWISSIIALALQALCTRSVKLFPTFFCLILLKDDLVLSRDTVYFIRGHLNFIYERQQTCDTYMCLRQFSKCGKIANLWVCVFVCVGVGEWGVSSILWVNGMNLWLINQNKSFHSSDKFNYINYIAEKGMNLNLSGIKVPTLHIGSVPQFKMGKFALIQHFRLLQFGISSSSFGVLRLLNLPVIDCTSLVKIK